jgi:uncharacterized membrane protein YeiH
MRIHAFDLVGVFAFAVFGSHKALEKQYNIYGTLACAALTALGGGTIREIILRHPPIYFADHAYLYVTVAGALLTMLVYDHFARIRSYALLLDAVGLAVFSFIGAQSAAGAGLGLVGMIFFASLTAAGGGILTDIVLGDKPTPFTCEVYVLPAGLGGLLYRLFMMHRPTITSMSIVLLVPFVVRVGWLARKGEIRAVSFLARDPESRAPRRRWALRPVRTVAAAPPAGPGPRAEAGRGAGDAAQLVSAGGPGSPR